MRLRRSLFVSSCKFEDSFLKADFKSLLNQVKKLRASSMFLFSTVTVKRRSLVRLLPFCFFAKRIWLYIVLKTVSKDFFQTANIVAVAESLAVFSIYLDNDIGIGIGISSGLSEFIYSTMEKDYFTILLDNIPNVDLCFIYNSQMPIALSTLLFNFAQEGYQHFLEYSLPSCNQRK